MGQALPQRHPAVVLRSHHRLIQALLAITMAAVVALSVTVVIVANDGDEIALNRDAGQAQAIEAPQPPNGARYDGGPEEGSRGLVATASPAATRYDGGPDEGTRGPFTTSTPDPGFKDRAGGPRYIPTGPGAR